MNGNEIVALARQTYIEQFVEFVRHQAQTFPGGAPEARTQRGGGTFLYGGHFRIDFLAEAATGLARELTPDRIASFDVLDGAAAGMQVRMEELSWDDVEFVHDLGDGLGPKLRPWFERWYDPEDKRAAVNPGQPAGVIHWVWMIPGRFIVDFGTAPADAFWALVALLRDAGAKRLTIRETRAHTPNWREARPTPSTG